MGTEKSVKVFSFTILGTLPGLNEIVGCARANKFAGAAQKKRETERCTQEIMIQRIPMFSGPVGISFSWIEPTLRRDPDNICAGAKFILDALVETGRIPNDSRRFISGITHIFPPPDKTNPRVEVTITEAPGAKPSHATPHPRP